MNSTLLLVPGVVNEIDCLLLSYTRGKFTTWGTFLISRGSLSKVHANHCTTVLDLISTVYGFENEVMAPKVALISI